MNNFNHETTRQIIAQSIIDASYEFCEAKPEIYSVLEFADEEIEAQMDPPDNEFQATEFIYEETARQLQERAKQTITVRGTFGDDKKVTRQGFVNRWKDHVSEVRHLSWSDPRVDKIIRMTVSMALNEFDRLITRQGEKA